MLGYQKAFIVVIVAISKATIEVDGFSVLPTTSGSGRGHPTICLGATTSDDAEERVAPTSRRDALMAAASSSVGMMALLGMPLSSQAEDKTIYLTGKAPKVPGQKPKDKSDFSGTKKDPNFLRSISDCKNQCEKTLDENGLAKTKEDCLSECQDICCTTYEQCTFAIVPRI